MAEITHGDVTVTYADHIEIPPEAGKMSSEDLARLEKARRGVGITAIMTATSVRKFPDIAPRDVSADEMEKLNRVAVVMTAATGAFAVLTVVGPAVKSKDEKPSSAKISAVPGGLEVRF